MESLIKMRSESRLNVVSSNNKLPPFFENSPPKAKVPEVMEISPPLKLVELPIETVPAVEEISPSLMLSPFFKSRSASPVISF